MWVEFAIVLGGLSYWMARRRSITLPSTHISSTTLVSATRSPDNQTRSMTEASVLEGNDHTPLEIEQPELSQLEQVLDTLKQQGFYCKNNGNLVSEVEAIYFDESCYPLLFQPHIKAIHYVNQYRAYPTLPLLASATKQAYPLLSQHIQEHLTDHRKLVSSATNVRFQAPYQLVASVNKNCIRLGTVETMKQAYVAFPPEVRALELSLQESTHDIVYIAIDQRLAAVIEISTTIKTSMQELLDQLDDIDVVFDRDQVSPDHKHVLTITHA